MMEMSDFPEGPILDTSDDGAESPQTEDADEGPDPQDIPGPSEPAAAQDPLPHGGKKRSKKKATLPSEKSGRELNESEAAVPKPPTSSLSLLIFNAVANSKKKSGISVQALKKIVANMGYDMTKKKHYFLRAIRNMVAKGQLWQIKGTGATGSFKVNPEIEKKNPPIVKRKRPKARRSKRNKKRAAKSKKAREAPKKQAKANVKKPCKRGKMSSVQAASTQVQV